MTSRPSTLAEVLDLIAANPVTGPPQAMRAAFERLAGPQPMAKTVRIAGHEALVVGDGPTLLWLHAGGLVFGSPESHTLMANALASVGLRVVMPHYALAPERVWPAMREDVLSVVGALAADGPLVVGGVSAGGQLALMAARHVAGLAGVAVLSPNTDRTGRSPTRAALSQADAMNDSEGDTALARIACPDADPRDPDLSPVLADLCGLAPLHVEVGAREVLLGDSLDLVRKASMDGVRTSLNVSADLFHLAALWPDAIAPARAQLSRIGAFTLDRLG